jgi:uncharacterized membrane protein SpoIIM required for sporulation
MNPEKFEEKYHKEWDEFEQWVNAQESSAYRSDLNVQEVPHLYRRICNHLSLAKDRMYSPQIIDRLNRIALSGHSLLYKTRLGSLSKIVSFFAVDFPAAVRKEWKFFWLSAILYFGSLFTVVAILGFYPEFVYEIINASYVSKIEAMYDPAMYSKIGRRGASSDFQMFGFYIYNNTTISIKVFVSGIFLGLGTLFYLLVNGLMHGAIIGHLVHNGYSHTILPFIVGHSSFELLGAVIAGAAGFKLGFAIINPGRKTRARALVDAAKTTVILAIGFIIMDFIAAFLEAFWSSQTNIVPEVKFLVGGLLWLSLILYFLFAGRKYET